MAISASHKKKWLVLTIKNDSLNESVREEMTSRLRAELISSFKVSLVDKQSIDYGLRANHLKADECVDIDCLENLRKVFKADDVVKLSLISSDSVWLLQGWIENSSMNREVYVTQKRTDEFSTDMKSLIRQWSEKALNNEFPTKPIKQNDDNNFILKRPVESLLILGGLIQLGLAQVQNEKAFDSYKIMKQKWNEYKNESDSLKSEIIWSEYLNQRKNVLSLEKKRNYYWLGIGVAALLASYVWFRNTPENTNSRLNLNLSVEAWELCYAF